jgi:hypothetical protein
MEHVVLFGSRARESRDDHGKLSFARGEGRLRLISHLPVLDLDTQVQRRLSEFETLYSPEWHRKFL